MFIAYSSETTDLSYLRFAFQLTITLKKEEGDSKTLYNEHCYAGGLVEYVKWLNTDKVYTMQLPYISFTR